MRRLLCTLGLLYLVAFPKSVFGYGRLNGWCENGNYSVTIPGGAAPSVNRFQRSFPSCTVTVYNASTVTLASIYSDNLGTVKANPFTASSSGQYFFYASDGRYDIRLSGSGIPAPFTIGDNIIIDISGIPPNINACTKGGANAGLKIIAALAALPATGGTVDARCFQGAQTISDAITIGAVNKPITLLFGSGSIFTISAGMTIAGPQSIIDFGGATFVPSGSFNVFTITASQTTYRDLIVNASGLTGSVFTNTGSDVQQTHFQNVQIINATASSPAILFSDIYLSWFDNVRVTYNAGIGMHLRSTIAGRPVNSIYIAGCDFSGGTGSTPQLLLEGVAGVQVTRCSFQNNANNASASDVRIYSNSSSGVSGVFISSSYFEVTTGIAGNNVYIGDPPTGSNPVANVQISDSYFQSSKKFIKMGAQVTGLVLARDNRFVPLAGVPSPYIDPSVRIIGEYPGAGGNTTGTDYVLGGGFTVIDGSTAALTKDVNIRTPVLSLGGSTVPDSSGLQSLGFNVISTPSGQINETIGLTPDWQAGIGSVYGTNISRVAMWCYGSDTKCVQVYAKPFQTPLTSSHLLMELDRTTGYLEANGFMVGGFSGMPTLTSGSGIPAPPCTTGSLYQRTDGGAGTSVYKCESNTWVGF